MRRSGRRGFSSNRCLARQAINSKLRLAGISTRPHELIYAQGMRAIRKHARISATYSSGGANLEKIRRIPVPIESSLAHRCFPLELFSQEKRVQAEGTSYL